MADQSHLLAELSEPELEAVKALASLIVIYPILPVGGGPGNLLEAIVSLVRERAAALRHDLDESLRGFDAQLHTMGSAEGKERLVVERQMAAVSVAREALAKLAH